MNASRIDQSFFFLLAFHIKKILQILLRFPHFALIIVYNAEILFLGLLSISKHTPPTLHIFHTAQFYKLHFPHPTFSTLHIFHAPHSALLIFHTAHSALLIFHTPIFHTHYFQHSSCSALHIFALLIFHTPHFLHSHFPHISFSTLLIFHTPPFLHFTLRTPHFPHSLQDEI